MSLLAAHIPENQEFVGDCRYPNNEDVLASDMQVLKVGIDKDACLSRCLEVDGAVGCEYHHPSTGVCFAVMSGEIVTGNENKVLTCWKFTKG